MKPNPPAQPGALSCEPLKAANGGANAPPATKRHRRGGPSPPESQLVQARVFLFLLPDVPLG